LEEATANLLLEQMLYRGAEKSGAGLKPCRFGPRLYGAMWKTIRQFESKHNTF
jgi:hypothetical protein